MKKKNILVFPCGSEIGLEIHRSLSFSTHFEIIGASSADDHGRFVYQRYVGNLPFHNDPNFENAFIEVIKKYKIDGLYPAMDAVAVTLHKISKKIGIKIIGSSYEATKICSSKKLTYEALDNLIPLPKVFDSLDDTDKFPVFIKPDEGYGSRNTLCAENFEIGTYFLERFPKDSMLILENLPGNEWTIDCFSDRYGTLLFHAVRRRQRISNGISVRTTPSDEHEKEFSKWANQIQAKLGLRGAWFFQAKLDKEHQ
jgi:carbamoylphosphate synthase large subunit